MTWRSVPEIPVPTTVFVTDGNERSALAIVRALGRRQMTVIVGDSQPASLSSTSRYCERHVTYPSPQRDRMGFERFLIDFVSRGGIDIVLPVSDVTTHAVCTHQETIASGVGHRSASAPGWPHTAAPSRPVQEMDRSFRSTKRHSNNIDDNPGV